MGILFSYAYVKNKVKFSKKKYKNNNNKISNTTHNIYPKRTKSTIKKEKKLI